MNIIINYKPSYVKSLEFSFGLHRSIFARAWAGSASE